VVGSGDLGTLPDGDGIAHAFLWSSKDGMRDLGTLGGTFSVANAVNDAGVVIGSAEVNHETGFTNAFYWDSDVGMIGLGTLNGGNSVSNAFNAEGIVVGASDIVPGDPGTEHATIWIVRKK